MGHAIGKHLGPYAGGGRLGLEDGQRVTRLAVVHLEDQAHAFDVCELHELGAVPFEIEGVEVVAVANRTREPAQKVADAVSALIALGSKPKEAQEAVRGAVIMLGPDTPVDEIVRAALSKGK